MFELLKWMLKEELRLHEALFDWRFFFLFPVAVLGISYAIAFSMGAMFGAIFAVVMLFGIFFVYGLMVGTVGLHAKDALSIRFSDLSLILYSSRSLPVSRRELLLTFALQDLVYYLILTIVPFSAGAYFAMGVGIFPFLWSFFGFFASFFLGLSVSFLIAALYTRLGKWFVFTLAILGYAGFVFLGFESFGFFESNIAFLDFFNAIGISMAILYLSGYFFDFDAGIVSGRRFDEYFIRLSCFFSRLHVGRYSFFAAKDMIDMARTSGGFSKIVFSYLLPSALLWVFFDAFLSAMGIEFSVLTFSVVLGVVSTSIYNWLCQYERFSGYSIYPVAKIDVVLAKVVSFVFLSAVFSTVALAGVCLLSGGFSDFVLGMFIMFSSSSYVLAVLVKVAGLEPNAMLYDVRVMLKYFAYCLPCMIPFVMLTFFDGGEYHMMILFFSLLSGIASIMIFRRAFSLFYDE